MDGAWGSGAIWWAPTSGWRWRPIKAGGQLSAGPLFLMEKMNAGFNADTGNWRYTMIMPNGSVFGTTGGAGSAKMRFCADCHLSVAPEVDSMLFVPEEYRVE